MKELKSDLTKLELSLKIHENDKIIEEQKKKLKKLRRQLGSN